MSAEISEPTPTGSSRSRSRIAQIFDLAISGVGPFASSLAVTKASYSLNWIFPSPLASIFVISLWRPSSWIPRSADTRFNM